MVKTVTGDTYTITGDVVERIKDYLKQSSSVPLGWVSSLGGAINFNHVVSIEFKKVT